MNGTGIQIHIKKKNRRVKPEVATDFEFDIIILLREKTTQELHVRVESSCVKMWLKILAVKTMFVVYEFPEKLPSLRNVLETVADFKYFGSCVSTTAKDIKTRKTMARRALNQ